MLPLKLRQIDNPVDELKIINSIPILSKIADDISEKVRNQYEVNPYPRWEGLKLTVKQRTLKEFITENHLRLYDKSILKNKDVKILIAGCGTGQHSIEAAKWFKNSKITAIDLSKRSLAYAERQTRNLRIESIEYLQADILDILKLRKKFDIIESIGVLHHMNDPLHGWKNLVECLKPSGIMKIGLYSRLARRQITRFRKDISDQNHINNLSEMRRLRDIIVKSGADDFGIILKSPDFFSMSGLRDLLFNVNEHCFSLPEIATALDSMDLFFNGLQSPKPDTRERFSEIYSKKEDFFDLHKWHSFEQKNPDTFFGMYQFWCQKK